MMHEFRDLQRSWKTGSFVYLMHVWGFINKFSFPLKGHDRSSCTRSRLHFGRNLGLFISCCFSTILGQEGEEIPSHTLAWSVDYNLGKCLKQCVFTTVETDMKMLP